MGCNYTHIIPFLPLQAFAPKALLQNFFITPHTDNQSFTEHVVASIMHQVIFFILTLKLSFYEKTSINSSFPYILSI
jgi:hypothetical protein